MTLFTIACLLALIACLTPLFIPTSPAERHSMGVHLPEDDDEYKFIDLNATPEELEQIMKEFKNAK